MLTLQDLDDGMDIVYSVMAPTPQYAWPQISERVGCEVWVKHENHSPIGCFKLRGGLAYLEHVSRAGLAPNGVVAPTRGNHGQSIALSGRHYGVPVRIVVPLDNQAEKNAAIRALGAELIEHGRDYQEAREFALRMVDEEGFHMVRSFTPELLRGVATYPFELFNAVADLDALYVPIGMGSGICASMLVRDLLNLKTAVIGVVAADAPMYALSFEQGKPVSTETARSIADGLACRIPDPGVADLLHRRCERILRVTDDEIMEAAAILYKATHNLTEASGAAALAGLMQERARMQGKRVAVVLSGGNLDSSLLPLLMHAVDALE